jgi:hypothetical protein
LLEEVSKLDDDTRRSLDKHKPLKADDYENVRNATKKLDASHKRSKTKTSISKINIQYLLESLLREGPAKKDRPRHIDKNYWKDRLAVDLVEIGLNYLVGKEEFQRGLQQRTAMDMLDILQSDYKYRSPVTSMSTQS